MEAISEYLINNFRFTKIKKFNSEDRIDFNSYDCVLRIHDQHFLYYSDLHKCFTITYRYTKPIGLPGAGGHYKNEESVMIPKTIYTKQEVENFIKLIL